MKILFFGTPQLSVPYLQDLLKNEEVVGVITRADRPSGRGQHMHPPPVKLVAQQKKVPVFQPEKFTPEMVEDLKKLEAQVGVVVSYGKLIPERVFTIPPLGCFNVHFSLLPKYRGAGPVQWTLINGETNTGVTTFWIEKTMDSGPILVQESIPIHSEDNSMTLFDKLIPLGVEVMRKTLSKLKAGECKGIPQQGEPTFAPLLKKEDGIIDWTKPAQTIYNLIRGTKPWPGAYTAINDRNVKIIKSRVMTDKKYSQEFAAGHITELIKDTGFIVACGPLRPGRAGGQGFLLIEQVHAENKKPMSAWAFAQGSHLKVGDKIWK